MSGEELNEMRKQIELMRHFCELPATFANNFFLLPRGEGVRVVFIETVHETVPSTPRASVYMEMEQFRKLISMGAEMLTKMDAGKEAEERPKASARSNGEAPPADVLN